jgi:hypothetical protein
LRGAARNEANRFTWVAYKYVLVHDRVVLKLLEVYLDDLHNRRGGIIL